MGLLFLVNLLIKDYIMKISIVTSLYNTSKFLPEFYNRCKANALQYFDDYEFIIVNDGSPDNGLSQAVMLHEQDSKVKVIDLSRNFGQHTAIRCGLEHAIGDYIFVLDSDLEETPEWLSLFYNKLKNADDVDVVYGIQLKREGSLYRRYAGAVFYKFLTLLSDINIPENTCIARVMSRRYLNSLLLLNDKTYSLLGLFHQTGYKQIPVLVNKPYKGESSYTFKRKLSLAMDTIIGSTSRPLYLLSAMGIIITLFSFLYIIWTVFRVLFLADETDMSLGWASVFVSVWFFGGIIQFSIGFVGLYVSRIFIECKNNPMYMIKKIWK